MIASMARVYDEVIEFIARGTTPNGVAAWEPSATAKARVAELIIAEKAGLISPAEVEELNHFLELEHIMRMAKATARRLGGQAP